MVPVMTQAFVKEFESEEEVKERVKKESALAVKSHDPSTTKNMH